MDSIADQDEQQIEAPVRRLRVREVAARFGVSPKTVTRWADAGLLDCTRTLGGVSGRGHRRFDEGDVAALLPGAGTGGAQ